MDARLLNWVPLTAISAGTTFQCSDCEAQDRRGAPGPAQLPKEELFNGGGKGVDAQCGFSGCMIRTMASPGRESESLNSQSLVDSMPAMIHTARPDGYLDYFDKRWLEYLGVIMYDVSQWKCRAFVHREVEGIVAKWRACLATGERFGYETRVRGADGEYRRKLHCKVPLREGCGNDFHVKDLVDRFRANDRTHAVTNCDPVRALKSDSLWHDR